MSELTYEVINGALCTIKQLHDVWTNTRSLRKHYGERLNLFAVRIDESTVKDLSGVGYPQSMPTFWREYRYRVSFSMAVLGRQLYFV